MKIGFLSAPYPSYVVIAEPSLQNWTAHPILPTIMPSLKASPWFMTSVMTGVSGAPPPNDAYEIASEGEVSLQRPQGLPQLW